MKHLQTFEAYLNNRLGRGYDPNLITVADIAANWVKDKKEDPDPRDDEYEKYKKKILKGAEVSEDREKGNQILKNFYSIAKKYSRKLSEEDKKILRSWVVNLPRKYSKKYNIYDREMAKKKIIKNNNIKKISHEFLKELFKGEDYIGIYRSEYGEELRDIFPESSKGPKFYTLDKDLKFGGTWKDQIVKKIKIEDIIAVPALSFLGWDQDLIESYENEYEIIA